MNKPRELKWVVFFIGLLIAVFGLLTKFQFEETLDLQIHDTYVVIHNFLLLIIIGLILTVVNLLAPWLKRLATRSDVLKLTSIVVAGSAGLCCIVLSALMVIRLTEIPHDAQYIQGYGMLLFTIGLGLSFVLRTVEMLKIK